MFFSLFLVCILIVTEKQLQDEKLEMYRQAHSSLVEVTGESDLREIAHMFAQYDQKNFARISYINELQNKRNTLRHSTDKMKACAYILFTHSHSLTYSVHFINAHVCFSFRVTSCSWRKRTKDMMSILTARLRI